MFDLNLINEAITVWEKVDIYQMNYWEHNLLVFRIRYFYKLIIKMICMMWTGLESGLKKPFEIYSEPNF